MNNVRLHTRLTPQRVQWEHFAFDFFRPAAPTTHGVKFTFKNEYTRLKIWQACHTLGSFPGGGGEGGIGGAINRARLEFQDEQGNPTLELPVSAVQGLAYGNGANYPPNHLSGSLTNAVFNDVTNVWSSASVKYFWCPWSQGSPFGISQTSAQALTHLIPTDAMWCFWRQGSNPLNFGLQLCQPFVIEAKAKSVVFQCPPWLIDDSDWGGAATVAWMVGSCLVLGEVA